MIIMKTSDVKECNTPIVPEQGPMNLETALRYLTASYRKGMDSVKDVKDWIPANEVDRNLSVILENQTFDYLKVEYQKGLASAKEDNDWVSLNEVRKRSGGGK